jgi:hypothetical protein
VQKSVSILWITLLVATPLALAAQSPADIGELFASESTAQGPVLLAGTGMSVASGSQLAAGKSVATLRLARGGEVRLCPNASLAVSALQSNVPLSSQELMLSMDTGSLELDYPLNDLADTLITPDFKILLAGPGVFHFGFGVNNHGDTCIKPLRGNSASLIVTEMLGSGVYQVKPDETVTFFGGKLSGRGSLDGDCGCPRPLPVLEAGSQDEPQPEPAKAAQARRPGELAPGTGLDVTAPPPGQKTDAVHVQVEAPLVYLGDKPEPAYTVARIRFSRLPNVFLPQESRKPEVLKPGKGESAQNKENKGFFGRVKGFFAAIFR